MTFRWKDERMERRMSSRGYCSGECARRSRARFGVTFIEICMAVAILAMALIPIAGLITGGLARSDLSVSYTTAAELAEGILNNMLSDSFPFVSIPETPAGQWGAPGGSVAADPNLDPIFEGEEPFTVDGNLRYVVKNGIRYDVEIWVLNYGDASDLEFHYYESPRVNYYKQFSEVPDGSPRIVWKVCLQGSDYPYSPYNESISPANLVTGAAWCTVVRTVNQSEVSEPVSTAVPPSFQNFKKIWLRISWSGVFNNRRGIGRQRKSLDVVTFRANLSE